AGTPAGRAAGAVATAVSGGCAGGAAGTGGLEQPQSAGGSGVCQSRRRGRRTTGAGQRHLYRAAVIPPTGPDPVVIGRGCTSRRTVAGPRILAGQWPGRTGSGRCRRNPLLPQ